MKELKIIEDFSGVIKEELNASTIFAIYHLLQKQAKLSYQQAIEEALQIVKSTIGEDNNTYQDINNLLINEDKSNNN